MMQGTIAKSARQRAEAYLARIERRADTIEAFASLDPQIILAEAGQTDRSGQNLLLRGTMIGVKDVIDARGWSTRCNSPICSDRPAQRDATVVARLRQAGATIFGKTVTTEFAYTEPGPTTNPLDPARSPGGSSSGSAAAVADYQVDAALTTQTGGSTIRPASFCGIFGYKPCFGRVPNDGLRLLAPSFDTIGLHARSVEDLGRIAGVMEDRRRPIAGEGAVSFAHLSLPGVPDAQPYALAAAAEAAEGLKAAGCRVRSLELPEAFAEVNIAHRVVMSHEVAHSFSEEMQRCPELLSQSLRDFIELGHSQLPRDLARARATLALWRAELPALFAPGEVLIMPSTVAEAHIGLATTGSASFNRAWTVLGLAVITIPFGKGPAGMPLGLQIADPDPRGDSVFPAAAVAARALKARATALDRLEG